MPPMLRFGLLCIAFVLCIGHIAYAQMAVSPSDVSVGEIRLQVNDPSGAGLRAIGNLTGSGTNRTFQTDVQGAFSLSGLAFGRYELRISRSGFVSRIVTVHVNSPAPVSLKVTLLVQGTSTNIAVFSPTSINTDNVSFTLVPIFLDGTTFDDGDAVDTQVLLHGTVNTPSIYATDTFTYGPWAATLSGRYNHTSLDNLDYLSPSAARGNLTSYKRHWESHFLLS
jgi:hypothetical protein